MTDKLRQAELLAAEAVGDVIEHWGFRKALGRAWTVLYLEPEPLGAAELAERLSMSDAIDGEALDAAQTLADRLLRINPASEEAHRALMRIHLRHGRTNAALRQFEQPPTGGYSRNEPVVSSLNQFEARRRIEELFERCMTDRGYRSVARSKDD